MGALLCSAGKSGGHKGELRAIEFPRIKGGKPFDKQVGWFQALLGEIGQADGAVKVSGPGIKPGGRVSIAQH